MRAAQLQQIRQKIGLNKSQMAHLLDVHYSTYSRWEDSQSQWEIPRMGEMAVHYLELVHEQKGSLRHLLPKRKPRTRK